MRESVKSRGSEKEQLQQERTSLLEFIQDFTATEQQLEREREVAQICASLAEACPGVFGRVIDLCKPSQKRLHVAVNVALAKFLDAVIVESSESARACVRYLKERMLPPMTFLPMADLRGAALDPRLQNLVQNKRGLPRPPYWKEQVGTIGGYLDIFAKINIEKGFEKFGFAEVGFAGLRLGLNCVSFDEKYTKAFDFLLGDVVVVRFSRKTIGILRVGTKKSCFGPSWERGRESRTEADSMAEGRRLAFEESRKLGVSCKASLRSLIKWQTCN